MSKNDVRQEDTIGGQNIQRLAKRIKSLRQEKGYTSHETFAYENDIPRAQYGRYERGEDLRYTSLMKVIKAFDMTPREFFSEGFEKEILHIEPPISE